MNLTAVTYTEEQKKRIAEDPTVEVPRSIAYLTQSLLDPTVMFNIKVGMLLELRAEWESILMQQSSETN